MMNEETAQKVIDVLNQQTESRKRSMAELEDMAKADLMRYTERYTLRYMEYALFVRLYQRAAGAADKAYTPVQIVERLQKLTTEIIRSYTLYPPSSTGIMDNLQKRCEAQAAAELQEIINNAIEGFSSR